MPSPQLVPDALMFRPATIDDLRQVVTLLHGDALGATREDTADLRPYEAAFREIHGDPNNTVYVAVFEGRVVGTLQLTTIRNLTYMGGLRAQIEGVRSHRDARGRGVGRYMIEEAVKVATSRGAHLVQLTSNKTRRDALEFYERMGFVATHEGFKRTLT
ncbi:MAG: GNAT family N-acetyltransferase [Nannocystaceae bacterium]